MPIIQRNGPPDVAPLCKIFAVDVIFWNDMPTLSGMRRRGIPPEALREFCSRIGLARADSTVEYSMVNPPCCAKPCV